MASVKGSHFGSEGELKPTKNMCVVFFFHRFPPQLLWKSLRDQGLKIAVVT